MSKTTAALVSIASIAALVGCATHEPDQTAQANAAQNYQGNNAGITEPMPAPTSTTTSTMGTTNPQPAEPQSGASPNTNAAGETGREPATTQTSPAANAAAPMTWTDGQILQVVHTADQGEIEQAQLARVTAVDGRVKKFAAMMIKDHTTADDEASSMAKKLSVTFEPSTVSRNLDTDVRNSSNALQSKSGTDFDRAYIQTQINEHQSVLATIDNELMPHAQSTDVKNLLSKIRGKIMKHLEQAQEIDTALHK
jgi:putative membrane protein